MTQQQYAPFRLYRRSICLIKADTTIEVLAWRLKDVNQQGNRLANPNDALGIWYTISYFEIRASFAAKPSLIKDFVIYAPTRHVVYGMTRGVHPTTGQWGYTIGSLTTPKVMLDLAIPVMKKRMKLYMTYFMRKSP